MSNYILPIIVLIIVGYGLYRKIDIYDSFIDGSKESFKMSFTIFPNLLAMVVSVNILVDSGILEAIINLLLPAIKVPIEVISLMVMRPISGSATLALLNTIYTKYGVDHFYSLLGSTIQGCTDTTLYIIALYYGSIKIKNTRYALKVSLLTDIIGISASVCVCYLLFS
jgi:Uncharacterized membrane protein